MSADRAEIARRAKERLRQMNSMSRRRVLKDAALVTPEEATAWGVAERDAALAEVEARLEAIARGREHLYDATYSTVDECVNEVRRLRAALRETKGGG